MIDAAQRQVVLDRPESPMLPSPEQVIFHIQGVVAQQQGQIWQETYASMAERGVLEEGERPLSIWARLRREEARIGKLLFAPEGPVIMTLWTRPRLVLRFPEENDLFRECEIMALSAGFHFRSEGTRRNQHKVTAF